MVPTTTKRKMNEMRPPEASRRVSFSATAIVVGMDATTLSTAGDIIIFAGDEERSRVCGLSVPTTWKAADIVVESAIKNCGSTNAVRSERDEKGDGHKRQTEALSFDHRTRTSCMMPTRTDDHGGAR